jgi:hypothetical protein
VVEDNQGIHQIIVICEKIYLNYWAAFL